MRVGVNGFGRIGRCVIRAAFENSRKYSVSYIQVNSALPVEQMLHMLKHDSTHGHFVADLQVVSSNSFTIDGVVVDVFSQRDLDSIKWNDVDVVMECTGAFKVMNELKKHVLSGASCVVLSCPPADDTVPTIVFGANEDVLSSSVKIVSIGSCTTNALAPPTKVIHDNIGIVGGFVSTVHAYTGDQNLLDNGHRDLRRARSAAVSMVPTSTGAAKSIHVVIPSLKGKLAGAAIRVPTPNVSLIDCTFVLQRGVDAEEVNQLFIKASSVAVCQSLAYTDEPLVSVDFNHNPYSSIVDLQETRVVNGNILRFLSWYDNEWAFSVRMLDMALLMV